MKRSLALLLSVLLLMGCAGGSDVSASAHHTEAPAPTPQPTEAPEPTLRRQL